MVNFAKLSRQAKSVIDKRGGTEALKGDLAELKDIGKGKGTLKEKAKAAGDALKEPGTRPAAHGEAVPPVAGETAPPAAGTPPTTQDLPPRA